MVAPFRLFARCALAFVILLSVGVAPAQPGAAQTSSPLFSASPAALTATVELGATTTLTLTLRNDQSAQSITPRLYEAFPQTSAALDTTKPSSTPPLDSPLAIDPQIAAAQAASPNGRAEVIVLLDDQADLSAAYAIRDWRERGRYVYETLRSHAEASQRNLRQTLAARGLTYTPLWIVNAIAVEASAADVAALAMAQDLASMWLSRQAELGPELAAPPAQASPGGCNPDAGQVCWNIARIGAKRVWEEFGTRGEGITMASIDSGVRFDHPALVSQYRGNGTGGPRHDYNWYDPYGGERVPVDAGNHGTHTMGTMVARGLDATRPAVGVAPGATWITARACAAYTCDEVDLIRAAQWLLAPTDLSGANPRPDLRPHIINNSWVGGRNASWFMGYVEAWRAAGIYPVFAGGNSGSMAACGTIQSPGDFAQVTAVGSTDSADNLSSFSGIGPTLDGRLKPDLVAPGQSVVSTAADERQYLMSNGTSMAAPHVAGAVALLWGANPTLLGDYEATYALLTGSATPRSGDSRFLGPTHQRCAPTASPNNIYGYGRLDVYRAVALGKVDVPWLRLPANSLAAIAPTASMTLPLTLDARMTPGPGDYEARVLIHGPDLSLAPAVVTITMHVPSASEHAVVSGQLSRADDGAPIIGMVTVTHGATTPTDTSGRYSITLPPSTTPYTLTAAALGYIDTGQAISVGNGERRNLDFALATDRPRLAVEPGPHMVTLDAGGRERVPLQVGNQGSQTLSYSMRVIEDHYGVWRSDEADGPAAVWSDPPATATTVSLSDDGATAQLPMGFNFPYFYGRYDAFSILANGSLVLAPLPPGDPAFLGSCLPLSETPGAAIAVLRLDLDPSKPGARVSYAHMPEGLLVTWEHVPLYESPDIRLSFQVLLMPDGRISLRYKDSGPIGPGESQSAGLQRSSAEYQSLGCKDDLRISDGLTIELRPQAPATIWLDLDHPSGTVAPGATSDLPITASWVSATPYQRRFSGVIELRSNDPSTPVTRVTVRMRTTAAGNVKVLPAVISASG